MDQRLERTVQALREVGADWAVLASVDGVAYATGHFAPVEAGPSPFAGGPTIALIDRNGTAGIACANVEAAAAGASRVTEVELYEGYAFDHGVDYIDSYRTAVGRPQYSPSAFMAEMIGKNSFSMSASGNASLGSGWISLPVLKLSSQP